MKKKNFLDLTVREVLLLVWKKKVVLLITILILLFISLSLFSSTFREHFLFDRYDKFQWIGVSAIFAGVGLYFSSILKKEEIRANVLTKNDLDLLKDFRENISNFSALVWKYNNVLNEVLQFSRQNKILEINFNAEFDENEKKQNTEYYNSKGNELNDMYFKIMELYTKIYFDLTISFDDSAVNVNESLTEIKKLLNNTIKMNATTQKLEDIQHQYLKIIRANDNLIVAARSYIVLVMENKVSSFNSKITDNNEK